MLTFYFRNAKTEIMEKLVQENKYKIVVPLFGAAYAAPNKGKQFYTDLDRSLSTVLSPTENSSTRHMSVFPVLFKADLIIKDFSSKPSKFKYVSSMCEPCLIYEPVYSKT